MEDGQAVTWTDGNERAVLLVEGKEEGGSLDHLVEGTKSGGFPERRSRR